MQRELPVYLADIVEQCQDIRVFTEGLSFEVYQESKQVRRAVERAFIILGEALVCSARLAPDINAVLPNARNVIAFRNGLVHNYSVVNESRVWIIVQQYVPLLQQEAERC